MSSFHSHAGKQHGDVGGGVEEGPGELIELLADLADDTKLEKVDKML